MKEVPQDKTTWWAEGDLSRLVWQAHNSSLGFVLTVGLKPNRFLQMSRRGKCFLERILGAHWSWKNFFRGAWELRIIYSDQMVRVSQRRWYLNWVWEVNQQQRRGMSWTQTQESPQLILGAASDWSGQTKAKCTFFFFLVRKITITKLGIFLDFPGGPVVKNLPVNAEDTGLAREDPTCYGAPNLWTCALEHPSHNYWPCESQLPSSRT